MLIWDLQTLSVKSQYTNPAQPLGKYIGEHRHHCFSLYIWAKYHKELFMDIL